MSTMDIEKFLTGGGAKSASFPEIGATTSGVIVGEPQIQQQKDISSGEPKTYKDGNPAMQLVIKVQTEERDLTDPDDDGVRAIYIKGQMKQAVADACRKAGAKAPEAGGTLAIKFIGEEPAQTKGFNPKKLYAAKYSKPPAAAVDAFLGTDEPPF